MNLPKIKHIISTGALLGFEKNALILFCFCNKYVYVKYLPTLFGLYNTQREKR